jgi:sugar (pentulose or hexulose) kinase
MRNSSESIRRTIKSGRAVLGVEFGSTRIKAVLIDESNTPIASGSYAWENQYIDGIWTYHLPDVWLGLKECYQNLKSEVLEKYGVSLNSLGALGISGMMHGYLAFDETGELLAPFRTWRNTITSESAEKLLNLFQFNIPQRWGIAHLYQAILNKEPHVKDIRYLTTLAGYVHWQLTGEKALGVGDASGMFPIDSQTNTYDARMLAQFNELIKEEKLPWKIEDILPKVLVAGESAGSLTHEGARLIDPSDDLQAGIPLCPPEGDAGTGMVATDSIAERTGNVSAGTSIFAMIVLENPLSKVYPEIDIVTTPAGKPVAMVHSNNGTTDLNAWVELFDEFAGLLGMEIRQSQLFETLYKQALEAEPDAGELLAYNTLSGEHITHLEEGRPLFIRKPESRFTLSNFIRAHLYAALATMRIGLDILFDQEEVAIDQIIGHGGFFKTEEVGQRMMAAATQVPVAVMETAGEGGAWGMALLASYRLQRSDAGSLEAFLAESVFSDSNRITIDPDMQDADGFNAFMNRYTRGLAVERLAVEALA